MRTQYQENVICRERKLKANIMSYDKTKDKITHAKRAKYNLKRSYKIGKKASDKSRYYSYASAGITK